MAAGRYVLEAGGVKEDGKIKSNQGFETEEGVELQVALIKFDCRHWEHQEGP